MARKDDLNTGRATAARMYDYALGGTSNFEADRIAAQQVLALLPQGVDVARANRAFLRRAVRYLANDGVDQFLDLGSGIPTVGNVHEVAQAVNPRACVVYVDIDPVAVLHSTQILDDNPAGIAVQGDLRDSPDLLARLEEPDMRGFLDLTRPIALMYVASLHFGGDEVFEAVDLMRDWLPVGSYLVVTHAAEDASREEPVDSGLDVYKLRTQTPVRLRWPNEIRRFFGEFEIIDPGLTWVSQWHPDPMVPDPFASSPEQSGILGGVGIKVSRR